MATTRTGSYPIGFRRGWGDWQKDVSELTAFALDAGFEFVDVAAISADDIKAIQATGIGIGSVDIHWNGMLSPDKAKRKDAAAKNVAYINEIASLGPRAFFTILMPEDVSKSRRDNFAYAAESYAAVAEGIAKSGARIAIEGWPGGGPHVANQCCTPETYRAMLKEVANPALGINFDPSHLIRMGIDSVRFAREFVEHFVHVHAKDTLINDEALYEFGHLQGATFAENPVCGEQVWRYTVPGHGVARWGDLFAILVEAKYQGLVSIELEDADFLGSDEKEQRGLIASRDFLIHA